MDGEQDAVWAAYLMAYETASHQGSTMDLAVGLGGSTKSCYGTAAGLLRPIFLPDS
jgi:hypothetical protein